MAVGVSDFNETEAFEEYNTHPYGGGYDIVLTYGTPLPPSPAICYPVSDASSNPSPRPQVPLPSVPVDHPVLPEASGKAIPNLVRRDDDLSEAEYGGSSNGYGERDFTTVDWWWNLSGFSPYMIGADGNSLISGCRNDAEELKFWGQLRRAADYIFGCSQGFGERRIGVDKLGIPIYAYKKHGNGSIHAEIEPPGTEKKLDYYCDSLHHESWSSTCNNRDDENYRFSNSFDTYVNHHPEEPLYTRVDPAESLFAWKSSQSGLYDNQVDPERKLVPFPYGDSRDEVNLYENLGMDYNTHHYEVSQNVQLEAMENSYQILSYAEESSYNGHENEGHTFNSSYYERQEYQESSHFELEPYRSSWAQCPVYYGISEEVSDYSDVYQESASPRSTWQTSSLGEWVNGSKFCSSDHALTCHDDGSLELEPFKPTWTLNPDYYSSYEERLE